MARAAFDTLATLKELEAAGMERGQAEAIAKAIQNGHGDLVTKSDLYAAGERLRGEIKAEVGAADNKMLVSQIAVAGLLFAALKLF